MDRVLAAPGGRSSRDRDAVRILPSRRAALAACRSALDRGPVLITGEAGIGKSWLAARLTDSAGPLLSWVTLDLTPATDPAGLLRLLGHELGLEGAADRIALGDFLAEQAADRRRWGLILDETHGASGLVLEEIRVISNRLGRADGFSGLVLVGQTPLARRLATRSLSALEARLAARVHLRPIDADEARALLEWTGDSDREADPEWMERIHRESGGNPRRLLALAAVAHSRPSTDQRNAEEPGTPTMTQPAPVQPVGRLGENRPPIRVEEGLIEVGWEPEADAALEPAGEANRTDPEPVAVNDHYAALQAWDEWARNQGRQAEEATATRAAAWIEAPSTALQTDEGRDEPETGGETPSGPHVWAEGQQGFAPYGQLFTRLRQSRDSEP
jgi:type II secretory pathway predicted ATPase ExeA